MKKVFSLLCLLSLVAVSAVAQSVSFVRGADVSWCTEMEADGMKFYNNAGVETDIFRLMKEIGMNTMRLRVWVNPENEYGPWCDKADVLAKAKRAKAEGLDVLIDFHYSDGFADPGKQYKPAKWAGLSAAELMAALSEHTKDVLQALKDEGVTPRWVQVGNEVTSGMVWDDGRIDWNKQGEARWKGFVALSNAGYDAVKEVFPDAYVIVHHDMAESDNVWFYRDFKTYGGKFDMIGLSHYPDWNEWAKGNTAVATNLKKLRSTFNVPVFIVETGFSTYEPERAESAMKDLYDKVKDLEGCVGVLYWEPEVYGGWDHGKQGTYGKEVVSKGAFTAYGCPSKALLVFGEQATDVEAVVGCGSVGVEYVYTVSGVRGSGIAPGINIVRYGDGSVRKVYRK